MTKLFDFISHHGHAIAEKRAKAADAQFAADHAARRAKPGVVLGSEGPGGLDGFFAEMEREREFNPWWLKVSLHIHWWMEKNGPRATWSKIRVYHQRGKRGWSNVDVWSLDHYLSKVIRDSVQHLNDTQHGWPGPQPGCQTFEEWQQILNEISRGMQADLDRHDLSVRRTKSEEAALEAEFQLAMRHLAKWWGYLWD